MTDDRNYLRMFSDRELINMGRERDSGDDLILVLCERLSALTDADHPALSIRSQRAKSDPPMVEGPTAAKVPALSATICR